MQAKLGWILRFLQKQHEEIGGFDESTVVGRREGGREDYGEEV